MVLEKREDIFKYNNCQQQWRFVSAFDVDGFDTLLYILSAH